MKILPMTDTVQVMKSGGYDDWGIVRQGVVETHKCRLKYKLDLRGNEVNTKNSTLEIVPFGTVWFEGFVDINYDDKISFVGYDGVTYTAVPDEIKPIRDLEGNIIYTKVSF
jgi:hypothetical protein